MNWHYRGDGSAGTWVNLKHARILSLSLETLHNAVQATLQPADEKYLLLLCSASIVVNETNISKASLSLQCSLHPEQMKPCKVALGGFFFTLGKVRSILQYFPVSSPPQDDCHNPVI